MKHIYNLSSAANTLRPTTSALGTALSGKIISMLFVCLFLLVSGESKGQAPTVLYGPQTFESLNNFEVQPDNNIGIVVESNQLRAYTIRAEKGYSGHIAIKTQSFDLKKGYTYIISFSARAKDHNNGGVGNISVLKGNRANINWSTVSEVLATGLVSKSTVMDSYTISFKAIENLNNQYLALRLSTAGGNQSELFLDNLVISETCTPQAPQVINGGSCSTNVPITLTASGAAPNIEEYRWYGVAEGGTAITGENGAQYTTPPLSVSREYYVSIYNIETTCESPRVKVIASVGGLIKPTVKMTSGSCEGGGNELKTYTASGGSEGSYRWYKRENNGSLTPVTVNNQLVTSSTLTRNTNSDKGTYYVGIVGSGCESELTDFSVSQGYPDEPTNASGSICGNQITLVASGAGLGESYRWYATLEGVTSFVGQGATVVTDVIPNATYSASKVNTASGCESTARLNASITTNTFLQTSPITGNAVVCQGTTGVTYSVPAVTGATYTWSLTSESGATGASIVSGLGTNQVTVNYPASSYRGQITVTVTNPCNSYTTSLSVQATNNNAATGEIIIPDNLELGQPAVFRFKTVVPDNELLQYQWYTKKPNSTTWTRVATARDWEVEAMPGDIDALKVDILVSNDNSCFTNSLGATETFTSMSFSIDNTTIVPLPVELISFNAQRHTKGVNLTWATASELDNKGFEVQVSTDSRNFTAIGFVESKVGTTSLKQNYSFLDTKAVSGTRYYRLKQIDFDGTSAFSNIRAVSLNGDNGVVAAYPNPFDDVVVVTLNGTEARTVHVILINTMGKVVHESLEETSGNSISVDMTKAAAKGMYMLHVMDNGSKHVFKMMKR